MTRQRQDRRDVECLFPSNQPVFRCFQLTHYSFDNCKNIDTSFYYHHHILGLVQERRNSSALAMELRLSCTNPSTS